MNNLYGGPTEAHQRSFGWYHSRPLRPFFPYIGGSQPPPKTSIAIISGTSKATDFKFCGYIHMVHPNKTPLKSLEKREYERIQGLPKFFAYPYYLGHGKSYGFQIWAVYSEGPSEQKPIKHFREKGAWAYPGIAEIFQVTHFKFGQYCIARSSLR